MVNLFNLKELIEHPIKGRPIEPFAQHFEIGEVNRAVLARVEMKVYALIFVLEKYHLNGRNIDYID